MLASSRLKPVLREIAFSEGSLFFIHRLPLAQTCSGRFLCQLPNPSVPPSSFTSGVIA